MDQMEQMDQMELLYRLQEVDLSISNMEKSLEDTPLIREVNEKQEEVEGRKAELEDTKEEIVRKKKKVKKLESELQQKSEESSSLRKKMYGGEIASTRELEQMEKKLNLLEQEKGELENSIIEEMEIIEEIESRKKKQEEELSGEEKKLKELNEKLEQEQEQIKEELEKMRGRRTELAEQVEPRFMERYETYSQRFNGRGIANVVRDICEGCRVYISSAIKGRLYKSNSLVYCENCGRILVWIPE